MVFHTQQIIIRKWKYSRNDRHITQIVLYKIKLGISAVAGGRVPTPSYNTASTHI